MVDASYSSSISVFAIEAVIVFTLLVCLTCFCMCAGLISKGGEKKKCFSIVKYKEKYDMDKAAVESLIPKTEGGESFASKLTCTQTDSCKVAGDVESQTNPLVMEGTAHSKVRYVCFTFDNLSPMLKASSALTDDEDTDPFRGLNDFVNIVIASCSPGDTDVILIIASPGGYAFKFEQSYSDLLRLRAHGFKITGLVDSICASGGYMLACGCDRIVCSPYAQLGSVGVIARVHNYAKLLEKVGVEERTFATGKYKAGFPQGAPYSEEDVETTRELIDETLVVFRNIVESARSRADIAQLLTARVWYGREAVERHMADELMVTSDDYLSRLCKAPGADVFIFEMDAKPKGALGSLLGSTLESFGASVGRYAHSVVTGASAAGTRLLRKTKPTGFVEL
jgi:signal peptide peptidase SppA